MRSSRVNRDHPRARNRALFAHFFAVFQNHREDARGLPEVQKLARKILRFWGFLPWDFYSRHLEHAHPGILAFSERSELKSCKWHLSDPELIAEALKCKKMLAFQGFPCFLHNVAPRWYQNIIVGSRCEGLHGSSAKRSHQQ